MVRVEQLRGGRDQVKLRQKEKGLINVHDLIRKGMNIIR